MFNQSLRLFVISTLACSPLIGNQPSQQMEKTSLNFELCPLNRNHNQQKRCSKFSRNFFKCCEKGPTGHRGRAGPTGHIGHTGHTGPVGPTAQGPLLDYASFASTTVQTLERGDLVTFETTIVSGPSSADQRPSIVTLNPNSPQIFTIQIAGDYSIDFGALVAIPSPSLTQDSTLAPPLFYFFILRNGLLLEETRVLVEPSPQALPVSTSIFFANLDVGETISVEAFPVSPTQLLLPVPNAAIPNQTAYITFKRLGP